MASTSRMGTNCCATVANKDIIWAIMGCASYAQFSAENVQITTVQATARNVQNGGS